MLPDTVKRVPAVSHTGKAFTRTDEPERKVGIPWMNCLDRVLR